MNKRLFFALIFIGMLVWFCSAVYAAIFNDPQMFLRAFVPVVMWCILVCLAKVFLDD